MGALRAVAPAFLVLAFAASGAPAHGGPGGIAQPAPLRQDRRWKDHIAEASFRFGIPASWIERVIRVESGGRPTLRGRLVTSRAGAMGLMQLMPGTWAEMRVRHGLGTDPYEPRDNILAGTAYLRSMYDRFGYPGLFAAYNAGPKRYAEHLATGRRLPLETIAYLGAVTSAPSFLAASRTVHQDTGIFVRLGAAVPPADDDRPAAVANNSLFARLSTTSSPN